MEDPGLGVCSNRSQELGPGASGEREEAQCVLLTGHSQAGFNLYGLLFILLHIAVLVYQVAE